MRKLRLLFQHLSSRIPVCAFQTLRSSTFSSSLPLSLPVYLIFPVTLPILPLVWTLLHAWHCYLAVSLCWPWLRGLVGPSVMMDTQASCFWLLVVTPTALISCSLSSLGFCRWLPPDLWTWSCCHFQIDTRGQETVMRGEERLSSLLANIFGCWTSGFQLSGKNFGRNWYNFIVISRFWIINSFFLKGRCWFHVRHWVNF